MYSVLQKIIGTILFSVSIFLASVSLWSGLNTMVLQTPAFMPRESIAPQKTVQYHAKELGVTGKGKSTPSSLYANGACLLDADSGRVLFQKNADKKLPMASTTKIMTCIIALEQGNLKDTVTFSSYAASMPDVQLNARSGESFLLKDLLYSLMLESHNDTAVAIAEHIGGSVEGFAEKMNQKAAELGLTNTHFVTPNGLDADGHYTTAKELCLIAAYAVQNETFCKIIRTKSHSFSSKNKRRTFRATNKDAFLTSYSGAIGIKTGFTGDAGYCFCGAARRNGITLISSVLASGWPPHKTYKWADTRKLMNYGFANFTNATLPEAPTLEKLPVYGGQETIMRLKRSKPATETKLLLTGTDTLKIEYDLPESITAPIRAGDIIGYENYYLNDTQLQSVPLAAAHAVREVDPPYMLKLISNLFCFHVLA
ncbi:MAG: D-alanyl-D-alanine carboxypeptidase [Lachnospiraceae bacterium]|nr:D-alanyl-D-alanine carboxypeptidase [Lachnospiraceae bacterium]